MATEIPCSSGTFSNGSQSACTVCPAGFACPDTTAAIYMECEPGTYSDTGESFCHVCPAGYECPRTDLSLTVPCESGTYSVGGAANCTVCSAGYQCDTFGITIQPCATGTFSVLGSGTCLSCPAGSYCPYTESNDVYECLPGTYSVGDQSSCTPCPAGYECPSTSESIEIPCPFGSFSIGSQASCTVCPAGFACPSTTAALVSTCPLGSFSGIGDGVCTSAVAGEYSPLPSLGSLPCPVGTYSYSGASNCTYCPAGYYCASPASPPSLCGVGYYSTGGATTCTLCNPGYNCPTGSTNPSPPGSECPVGTYCNPATTVTFCAAGTYGITSAGESQSQACSACDVGYYCPVVGTLKETQSICSRGGYCPGGSQFPVQCPSGTRSNRVGQTTSATCEACPSGWYCYGSGHSTGAICPEGYYCPTGTDDYRSFPCPAGTFSVDQGLYSAAQCLNCTAGNFCPAGSSSVSVCPSGTYLPYSGGQSLTSCLPCEPGYACPSTAMTSMTTECAAGHYCPGGTSFATEYPCPAGTYSDAVGLASISGCLPCPEGHQCRAGTVSATFDSCLAGYYCPVGTAYGNAIECLPGTYSNRTSLKSSDDCTPCPPGFYCEGGHFSLSGPCAPGFYCPPSSTLPHNNPCPAGTYSNSTDLFDVSECLLCPQGSFCPIHSTEPIPCPDGTYGVISGAETGNSSLPNSCQECPGGTRCPSGSVSFTSCGVGYYSRDGDSTCLLCELGHYCGKNTTSYDEMINGGGSWENSGDLAGVCFNGTYCDAGMIRPPDLLRNSCPRGYYCPTGTEYPAPCPAGRYGLSSGLGSAEECSLTPSGFYTVEASRNVSGMCDPGYYCPTGSTGPQQIPCPPRHYRPEFGGADISDCSLCVAGGYCLEGSAQPLVCPKGYFCPTGVSRPEPCAPGTYGTSFGLRKSTECTLCGSGTYCDGYGLTEFRGLCSPGFYCVSGVNTSTPYALEIRNDTGVGYGDICPVGHYCPLGSGLPTPCPAGRYSSEYGNVQESDCTICSPGYYCAGLANERPTGLCTDGYYCPPGSISSRQIEAPLGSYSGTGASNYSLCLPGFYQPMFAQSDCLQCPNGYYCPDSGMSTYEHTICPYGNYCPVESSVPFRCPIGTFSASTGLFMESQCSDCTPGYYCNSTGLSEVTGPCDAGYYCTLGAEQKTHDSLADSTGGVCPEGHYCPQGTAHPIECPKGTFMSSTGATGDIYYNDTQFFCDLCLPGYACTKRGMTTSGSSLCEAGYFCRYGSPSTTPYCEEDFCEDMYGACPIGHYCEVGTDIPQLCNDGTYMDDVGAEVCKECPIGYYCAQHIATSNYTTCPQV